MGNTDSYPGLPTTQQRAPRAHITVDDRFSVKYVGHEVVNDAAAYNFWVDPPVTPGAPLTRNVPGQLVQRSYMEFQDLDIVVAQRHRGVAPELPRSTLFHHTDPEFVSQRASALETYLESLLQLEPLPRTRALRRFLGISQPTSATSHAEQGPMTAGRWRLPVGVVAIVLTFHEPVWLLRVCSAVCRTMQVASRDARCWPSLKFSTPKAERWLDGLFALLNTAGYGMQKLALGISFEDTRLGISAPAGLIFTQIRRLTLGLGDAEAVNLGVELLECIESPFLQRIAVEGGVLTETFLHSLYRVVVMVNSTYQEATSGNGLVSLKLSWAPGGPRPLDLDDGVALALGQLLEVIPNVWNLSIGIPEWLRGAGIPREIATLQPPFVEVPNTQPLLANMAALPALQDLVFDFLSDDMLISLQNLSERSLRLRRAKFSGTRRHLQEPEEVLVTLLAKLGDEVEDLSFIVEMEASMRQFMHGMLRPRIGALPGQWNGRGSLRSLMINWVAFDPDGMQCIVENCPQLHTLLMDRCEYWTDDVVGNIMEQLFHLQHFRVRSSDMFSDQALYILGEHAHRLVSLEIEPSYSMSTYALDQLNQKISPGAPPLGGGGLMDHLSPSVGTVGLMAAMSGEPNPYQRQNDDQQGWLFGPEPANRASQNTLKILKSVDDEFAAASSPMSLMGPRRRFAMGR